MPEGHTIHRLADQHDEWFTGQPVAVSSPQGRFAAASRVNGQVFRGASAWGKHLLHHYDVGVVDVHLGLFGKFFTHTGEPPEPRDTCRMRVATGGRTIDLVGAITCALLAPGEIDDLTAGLGPDPLRDDADVEQAWQALQRKRVGIGRALLDQSVLAGVGNVYRAEVLFTHGIHPEVPAPEIDHATFMSMWAQLRAWMQVGVRAGRIATTDPELAMPSEASEQVARDEVGTARSRMTRDESLYVYKQDTCKRCGTAIRRWDLAGRWAYACESCQAPPRPSASC